MQWFPDILSTVQSLGLFAAMTFILLYFIGKWTSNRISNVCKLLEKASQNITLLTDSQKDPHTGEMIRRKHVVDAIESVQQDTVDDISDFIKGHCGASACPLVPLITRELNDMKKTLIVFAEDGARSRAETQVLIKSIYDRINSFIDNLGVEMISAMKTLAEVSKSQKKMEDRNGSR